MSSGGDLPQAQKSSSGGGNDIPPGDRVNPSPSHDGDGSSTSVSVGGSTSGATTSTLTAEMQNERMNSERMFLSQLLESALNGDGSKVKSLVLEYSSEHGVAPADVLGQFKDGKKRTALHFACQSAPPPSDDGESEKGGENGEISGDDDIVSQLVLSDWLPSSAVQSLVRLKDRDGLTPLMHAAQHSERSPLVSQGRVEALLQAGGNKLALARSHAGATPLHYAAGSGANRRTISILYDAANVALRTPSKKGGTPLHWAAASSSDRIETIEALVDGCGADVNALNEQGIPPLLLAAAAGNDGNSKALVLRNADRKRVLPGGVTVYHMAADLNLVGTLASLLEMDEKDMTREGKEGKEFRERKNDQGETPLDLAAQEGHVGCVMLLLPKGKNSEEDARTYIEQNKKEQSLSEQKVGAVANDESDGTKDEIEANVDSHSNDEDNLNDNEKRAKLRADEIAASSTVTDADRQSALQHKQQGNAHFAKHEWEDAVQSYTAAIDSDPADATFYSNRSASYLNLQRLEEALMDAVIARYLRPDWAKARYRMAMARLELCRFEDAAVSAWEGVQLDPDNEELKRLLQKCVKMGKRDHQQKKAVQEREEEKDRAEEEEVENLQPQEENEEKQVR